MVGDSELGGHLGGTPCALSKYLGPDCIFIYLVHFKSSKETCDGSFYNVKGFQKHVCPLRAIYQPSLCGQKKNILLC